VCGEGSECFGNRFFCQTWKKCFEGTLRGAVACEAAGYTGEDRAESGPFAVDVAERGAKAGGEEIV